MITGHPNGLARFVSPIARPEKYQSDPYFRFFDLAFEVAADSHSVLAHQSLVFST